MAEKMEQKATEAKATLKAFAPFEFRKKQYKEGDVFEPPSDLMADPGMEEFRRVNRKRGNTSRGKVYYYELPPRVRDGDPEILRVVLPVE